jgi:hypothetical protein
MPHSKVAALLLVSVAAALGTARASTIDKNIVTLPDGSKYVKLTVTFGPQPSPVGDHHMSDSYSNFSLVTCGRGMIWSVTSIDYYKGQVMSLSYEPKTVELSAISQGSVADEVYRAACGKD